MSVMSASANGLIGYWSLDGTANDTSGNGNNATPTNVTWVTDSLANGKQVANFNGSNSYITLPNL
jgi:hypothetical protein